jgi:hypothetical protein
VLQVDLPDALKQVVEPTRPTDAPTPSPTSDSGSRQSELPEVALVGGTLVFVVGIGIVLVATRRRGGRR